MYDTFELCFKFSQLILYLFTGVVGGWFVRCLILCTRVFSSCCCCFIFLYDEYEMILPHIMALPVSHRSDGEISGESFISRTDDHFVFISVLKLGSPKSDVLKHHLIG